MIEMFVTEMHMVNLGLKTCHGHSNMAAFAVSTKPQIA
jgi:hypothetical protein